MQKTKRHSDALAISAGACNPSGICHSIIEACQEVRDEHGQCTTDPAIALMVSQLAYICGIWNGVCNWHHQDFGDASEMCHQAIRRAQEVAP